MFTHLVFVIMTHSCIFALSKKSDLGLCDFPGLVAWLAVTIVAESHVHVVVLSGVVAPELRSRMLAEL